MNPVEELVAERIGRHGPVSFSEVMELALYHPEHGFYASGGAAGRRGDFLTSPEVGPLFGAVVAGALDTWWTDMGRPDPFVVVDAGAGPGTLARTILAAEPACAPALRYVLVERAAVQRARHGEHLRLTPAVFGLGPVVVDADGVEMPAEPGSGPFVVSIEDLPTVDGPAVVLANELLDNLPFHILERDPDGWLEVRVGLRDGALVEVPVAATDALARAGGTYAPGVPPGGRIPVQVGAQEWLRRAIELARPGGRVVAFDYTATSPELARRGQNGWLRTYRGHERGGHPLEGLGSQDITADVARDQLARVRLAERVSRQVDWLVRYGLDSLVEEGRRVWREQAQVADLAALKARSRVVEAEALTDPDGLGGFTVMEWSC